MPASAAFCFLSSSHRSGSGPFVAAWAKTRSEEGS